MNSGHRKTAMDYYWMTKFYIMSSTNEKYFILLVCITKVNRWFLDMTNIQEKIHNIRNGVRKDGTNYATIKNGFLIQKLQYSDTEYGYGISGNLISLREALTSQSPFCAQGLQKCNCQPAANRYHNNICACFKNKVLCGSKYHGSSTCSLMLCSPKNSYILNILNKEFLMLDVSSFLILSCSNPIERMA